MNILKLYHWLLVNGKLLAVPAVFSFLIMLIPCSKKEVHQKSLAHYHISTLAHYFPYL